MIHAYDKNYLTRAQSLLGVMFDFAVYDLKYSLEDFFMQFIHSSISSSFQKGDTSILGGKSGIELVLEVIQDSSKKRSYKPIQNKSPEYWTGWVLAYFQWHSGKQFIQINKYISISEIMEMYNPYHEMDISQFCDHMKELFDSRKTETNLKTKRLKAGLSQSQLAEITEVPLRTIQQYEQKQKKINAASVETIERLSKVLVCNIEDLLE